MGTMWRDVAYSTTMLLRQLRYNLLEENLVDQDGFMDAKDIAAKLRAYENYRNVTEEDVCESVERSVTQLKNPRLELKEKKVRVTSGQCKEYSSIYKASIPFASEVPPGPVFHGTLKRFERNIRSQGLLPGQRLFVHCNIEAEAAARHALKRLRKDAVRTGHVLVPDSEIIVVEVVMNEVMFCPDTYQKKLWLAPIIPVGCIKSISPPGKFLRRSELAVREWEKDPLKFVTPAMACPAPGRTAWRLRDETESRSANFDVSLSHPSVPRDVPRPARASVDAEIQLVHSSAASPICAEPPVRQEVWSFNSSCRCQDCLAVREQRSGQSQILNSVAQQLAPGGSTVSPIVSQPITLIRPPAPPPSVPVAGVPSGSAPLQFGQKFTSNVDARPAPLASSSAAVPVSRDPDGSAAVSPQGPTVASPPESGPGPAAQSVVKKKGQRGTSTRSAASQEKRQKNWDQICARSLKERSKKQALDAAGTATTTYNFFGPANFGIPSQLVPPPPLFHPMMLPMHQLMMPYDPSAFFVPAGQFLSGSSAAFMPGDDASLMSAGNAGCGYRVLSAAGCDGSSSTSSSVPSSVSSSSSSTSAVSSGVSSSSATSGVVTGGCQ